MNKKCDAKALITGKDIFKEIIGKAFFNNSNIYAGLYQQASCYQQYKQDRRTCSWLIAGSPFCMDSLSCGDCI